MSDYEQGTIYDALGGVPLSIGERWAHFHVRNPRVYEALCGRARTWIGRFGRRTVGIDTMFSGVRWEIALATSDPHFKINNSYSPWYSRWIMQNETDLDGLFELRRSEADNADLGALVRHAETLLRMAEAAT
ncbi:hypothetical protein RB614_37685 [Phytohabitans sp. ZYX-F-186]|uniref:Uncharacterized protein n=1 Tax=Phytohabitans maris TaxID=3071409 RepID=A0ABU0ZT85_9ACTN|nr:hypothetical protein [Phytohabitans sp. ZYX-F-186]MDQ7910241.1 hypothetical protein [Phytohabitans sp. ZYX-F-186]